MSRNYSTRSINCVCSSALCGWSGIRTIATMAEPCPRCMRRVHAVSAEPLKTAMPAPAVASDDLFGHTDQKGRIE